MRASVRYSVLACMTSLVILAPAFAQQNLTGTLIGTVLGANGEPKSYARVQLQGQTRYAAVSDVNGQFTIANFKTGIYAINVSQNDNTENLKQSIPGLSVTLRVKW